MCVEGSEDLIIFKPEDECRIAVGGPFDLATRMIKDDDKKNSFYQAKKNPTIPAPPLRSFYGC